MTTASVPLRVIEIKLDSRSISVADLTDSAPDAHDILAVIPAGKSALTLTVEEQDRLLRNRYPGLAMASRYHGAVRFAATVGRVRADTSSRCFATRHAIPTGRYLIADDVASVACDPKAQQARLGYDRKASAIFAAADLPAFSYVGAVSLPRSEPLKAGSKLVLRTISGSVTIDRSVRTLQSARPGNRLFVRTDDGEILSRRLAEGESQ